MPLQKGDVIGAYEIIAPLGQGGMATVYKAYHARLNRFVAIKMIHQAFLQDPNYVVRFEREAQIIAALEHPNIVPVYDYSEHEGEPYLVMKLIEGSTLKAILADGSLPVEDILTVTAPIASALDYAHSRGVLHRDIKPSNIILDKQGAPYLSDFGLARLSISGATTLSQDLMIGTPYYMSPEQALGKGEIDFRADLYSFGVVLYELFVGKVPFSEGTPYAIINDHIARELPLPSSLNPNVPPAVELVLLKALTKDPDDRYQSAAAMIEAMRAAVKSDAPRMSALSLSRQNALASATRHTVSVETREGKKTAPIKPKPSARRSHTVELVLLAVVLVLILALVAFLLNRRKATLNNVPTVAALQPTVLITLPPAPTVPPPTLIPTQAAPTQAAVVIPTQAPPGQPPPGANPPTVPPISVPEMTAQQARDAITRDPSDPAGYLALARTQLDANDTASAYLTLENGLSHVRDRIPYDMTAAQIAIQVGRYDAAFFVYSQALEDARNLPPYPAVRATAGQFLYEAATLTGQLTLVQIRALSGELVNNTSPIVSAMIGRAFLSSGNPLLAKASIADALAKDSTLAEAHLVNGEYQLEQGDSQAAKSEWQLALNAPDAPQWVRDRANELISSTS